MCSITDQPVHDGISQSWFSDIVIPFVQRQLGHDYHRFPFIPILQDLQERQPRVGIQRLEPKVIQELQAARKGVGSVPQFDVNLLTVNLCLSRFCQELCSCQMIQPVAEFTEPRAVPLP